MAKREVIIELRVDNKDAFNKLGQLSAASLKTKESIALLNSIIKENGGATAYQARQLGVLLAQDKQLSDQKRFGIDEYTRTELLQA